MKILALDIETYSPLDLEKVGMHKYAENCEVLLVAYAYNDSPVNIIDVAQGEQLPSWLVMKLNDCMIYKTAFNAAFEMTVLEKYLGKKFDAMQWQCTQLLAKSLGLPASLEQVGDVLNLASDKRKMATGKTLMPSAYNLASDGFSTMCSFIYCQKRYQAF